MRYMQSCHMSLKYTHSTPFLLTANKEAPYLNYYTCNSKYSFFHTQTVVKHRKSQLDVRNLNVN